MQIVYITASGQRKLLIDRANNTHEFSDREDAARRAKRLAKQGHSWAAVLLGNSILAEYAEIGGVLHTIVE